MLRLEIAWDAAHRKIDAIKFIRGAFGMGLKESKNFVECGETQVSDPEYQWFTCQIDDDTKALQFLLESKAMGFRTKKEEYFGNPAPVGWHVE